MHRQALVVGVEGAAGSPADEMPARWPRLDYAAPYARGVRELLEKEYAYVLLKPDVDPASTAAALDEALITAATGDADFTVIHLLAQGKSTSR